MWYNGRMAICELCPRRCGVRPGFCGAGDAPRVFRWGPHFGEEPPLVGAHGSGCVFFSRCTMRCLYCQNSPWSWRGEGTDKSIAELTDIFRELAVNDRVENWNLVSPTPYLPQIREAVRPLLDEGVRLPFVWNSSGYERVETLEAYAELCDTALFDLRYAHDETASAPRPATSRPPARPSAGRSKRGKTAPRAAAARSPSSSAFSCCRDTPTRRSRASRGSRPTSRTRFQSR